MKLFYFYHFLKGGFYSKKIDISFHGKKDRVEIVKNILKKKMFDIANTRYKWARISKIYQQHLSEHKKNSK